MDHKVTRPTLCLVHGFRGTDEASMEGDVIKAMTRHQAEVCPGAQHVSLPS